MNGRAPGKHPAIITVTSSSRKAGKSVLASYLIRELGAEFGLKVSSGSHAPTGSLTSEAGIISTPGTDTGKLVEAGARRVLWVHADPEHLRSQLERAMSMFPEEGLLVVEGNSASAYIEADYAVFLMGVPFEAFKPSALPALQRADLVLVYRSGALLDVEPSLLEKELTPIAPRARIIFYDEDSRAEALSETARLIRERLK